MMVKILNTAALEPFSNISERVQYTWKSIKLQNKAIYKQFISSKYVLIVEWSMEIPSSVKL